MTEKGELQSDQVSLPPTYAPSETYTESPPPAYKQSGMAAVRVAKIVCITVLLMTFLIGSAIVAHKWIQQKDCSAHHLPVVHEPLPLVAFERDHIKDVKEEPIMKTSFLPLGESEINENVLEHDSEEELREMKKLKLPIDMLLGNPSLAGKDMPCNVEKRRQKIADGIFTEAVIVTCENEEKIDLPFSPSFSPNQASPPLSLISHIIKALASRPKSEIGNRDDMELAPNALPRRPFPFSNVMHSQIKHNEKPKPFPFAPGMVHIVPIKKFGMNRPHVLPAMKEMPMPFPPSMPQPFIKRISIRPINLNQNGMQQVRAESVIRQFPKFDVPNLPNGRFDSPPFGGHPIRIIKMQNNEGEQNDVLQRPPFPFPQNPIMKLFPMRRGKVLRVMPSPIAAHEALPEVDYTEQEENFNQFQRPIEIINHDEDNLEENVPEASGRSLPSPRVDIPGLKFLRIPNQPPFLRFPDARVMTHMELRRPPQHEREEIFPPPVLPVEEGEEFGPPRTHTVIESAPEPIFRSEPPIVFQSPSEEHESIINEPNFLPQTEPISLSQLQPRFFVPPPPRFAREGRFNPFAEINPEAEAFMGPNVEQGNNPNSFNHHLILNK